MDVRFPAASAPAVAPHHAALRKSESGEYTLQVDPGETVFLNGVPVERHTLDSGDVLALGENGPILRFLLLRDAPTRHKTVSETWRDALDGALLGSASRPGRLWQFFRHLPKDLLTQTSPPVRVALAAVALMTLVSVVTMAVFGFRLERRIDEEGRRVRNVEARIREQGERIDDPALRARYDELAIALSDRIEALEAMNEAGRTAVRNAEPAVVFLQGAYGWRSPDGRTLRIVMGPGGRLLRGPGGGYITDLDARGPPWSSEFTGSGFLAGDDGLVVTNRHVARPWSVDEQAGQLEAQGLIPVLRLRVYAPGAADPFDADFVSASGTSDLALLRAPGLAGHAAPLPLAAVPPGAGDEILVLGYPAGINALLARSGEVFVDSLRQSMPDFWSVAEQLAAADLIRPLASRGIVGQVTSASVVYDAETTRGGSGGPVLSLDGEVVAVTYGVLEGFGGSNLGVPVDEVRKLIARAELVETP
ncbi:MAG: trypsin-like peptidase domain-containing protein [Gemmatimonadota bacterium]